MMHKDLETCTDRSASALRLALPLLLCGVLCWPGPAAAQMSALSSYLTAPSYGGTAGAPPVPEAPKFGVQKNALLQQHQTPAGKLCISINPNAKAQIVNPHVYDHTLLLRNDCSQPIKIMACYFHTENCKTFTVAGYKRELKLFGIATEKEFRYEAREYLN